MSEAAHASSWELPALGGPLQPLRRREADLTLIEREAWERGHAQGREAGLAAAEQQARAAAAEIERRVQQLQGILDFMVKPLADLDHEVQRQLATLAGAIARQIVRREIKAQPDEIVAVVRETLALLPASAREVRVQLHPEDAELVRTRLSAAAGERAWSIVEDPVLARGGCRVTSSSSTIDAQLEQRLGAVIATVLGDERGAPGVTANAAVDSSAAPVANATAGAAAAEPPAA